MSRRVLLHPGFHKTGTSALQQFLWINRETLAETHDILLFRHLKPAVRIANAYARARNPLILTDLADVMADILAPVARSPRTLIISSEGLSGHIPGWPGVSDYRAAPEILVYLTGLISHHIPQAELTVLYTTRFGPDWLHSAWRHLLRGTRLTLDRDAFREAYEPACDLGRIIDRSAQAVAPLPVRTAHLEDCAGKPMGAAHMLRDWIDLTDPRLRALGANNAGPDEALADRFLAINTDPRLTDAAVQRKKQRLAEGAGLTGWVRLP